MSVGQSTVFLIFLVWLQFTAESSDMYEDDLESEQDDLQKEITTTEKCDKFDCNNFPEYALKCTLDAAHIYNSLSRTPPMPSKILDWCSALKFQVNCAIDWNTRCAQLAENHFNEETIKGHLHVIKNICEDNEFLLRYGVLHDCIESVSEAWEICYSDFKTLIDEEKNKTKDWTHYETHFYLCCARGHFRLCTLQASVMDPKCSQSQAIVLQKFSVTVSEGDVYQECERHIMYANCPSGDPRPPRELFEKFRAPKRSVMFEALKLAKPQSAFRFRLNDFLLFSMITLIIIW